MFTGLISAMAPIVSVQQGLQHALVCLELADVEFALGDSIAVDGVCITVMHRQGALFSFQLSPETLACTIACRYKIGQKVNFERPMQPLGHFNGHLVSGHVDQTMCCHVVEQCSGYLKIRFSAIDTANLPYLVKKGSICVNGVSLTINEVFQDGFNVMLIPHTQSHTNLSRLREGDWVNIEFDQLAKIVARQLECHLNAINQGVTYA
jgi:riboflavin synthase